MMRIASTGDWHVDEHNRFAETMEILEWFRQDVTLHRPDLICIGGDSAPVSVRPMTPIERNALAGIYQKLAAIAPVFIVRGNHDCAEEDIDIFSKLQSTYDIHAFSRPTIARGARHEQPFLLAAMPWPSKGFLMSRAKQDGVKLEDVNAACREAMRAMLMGIRAEFADAVTSLPVRPVTVLLGHLNVTGSDIGGFSLVGQDVEVGSADLEATGSDVVLLGHIHKRQSFGPRVHYPGSIRRVDFGEEGEEKGYLLVDLEPGTEPRLEFRPAPGRVMQTVHVVINEQGETHFDASVIPGADVRVIVDVDEERRSTLDISKILQSIDAGAATALKTEFRVTPTQRVRAPEMIAAKSDADRLHAWLGSLSAVPDEITTNRLLLKLDRIMGAVA